MSARAIYVESHIRTEISDLWRLSQDGGLHCRWDARFSDIAPLGVDNEGRDILRYSTTVAPGVRLGGLGASIGDRWRPDGPAYSGLKFWSEHPLSLIAEGAGHWRYLPDDDGGIRFLTRYDYRVRWGLPGRLIDRFVFRPLFGWATAWSFDRLRLWLEHGVMPERARNSWIARAASLMVAAMSLVLWLAGRLNTFVVRIAHRGGDSRGRAAENAVWQTPNSHTT